MIGNQGMNAKAPPRDDTTCNERHFTCKPLSPGEKCANNLLNILDFRASPNGFSPRRTKAPRARREGA